MTKSFLDSLKGMDASDAERVIRNRSDWSVWVLPVGAAVAAVALYHTIVLHTDFKGKVDSWTLGDPLEPLDGPEQVKND